MSDPTPTTTTTTTPTTNNPPNSHSHSPSPSPPPHPPIATLPGPRATALSTLYRKSLSSALSSISYSAFSACFPTIRANAPQALKLLHTQVVERLNTFAYSEFEDIIRERRVVERLNGLEGVIESARRRKARGVDADLEEGGRGGDGGFVPHTLPAPLILRAHLTPIYQTQQSQLNAKIQTIQSQNAILADEIKKQRDEIEKLLKGVETIVEDLDRANESLGREIEGLGKEALAAEGVLRDI